MVDAEWSILYNKLDKIVQSGAKVVLSKLPIGDVATQYFADRYCTTRRLEGETSSVEKNVTENLHGSHTLPLPQNSEFTVFKIFPLCVYLNAGNIFGD